MEGVVLVVRARWGQTWRPLFGLVLLGGLGLGFTLGCLAGARRTGSAYERFVTDSHPGDIEVGFDESIPATERAELARRVADLPQVERAGGLSWVFHTLPDGTRDELITFVAIDDRVLHDVYVPQIVEGRLPARDRADEVALNESAVDDLGIGVGDVLDLLTVPAEQQSAFFSSAAIEGGRPVSFDVTGVIRGPLDLEPGSSASAYLTPAYWDETVGQLAFLGPGVSVELQPGGRAGFEDAVRDDLGLPESSLSDPEGRSGGASVGDATRVQAVALAVFGGVIGLTTLVFLGLAFVRQAALGRPDSGALRALGMGRRDCGLVVAVPTALAALGAVVAAVAVAVAVSPWFPFGLAGRAEPDPGVDVDPVVLIGGVAGLLVVLWIVVAGAALVALRAPPRPSARPDRSVPGPLPVAAGVGMRLVINPGRGERAIPARSVLATAMIGVALVVATLTFGRSLSRLVDDPLRYGWSVDVIVGTADDPDTFEQTAAAVAAEPLVGDWTAVSAGPLVSGETVIHTLGVEPVVGNALPVVIGGRLPTGADEIALGRGTMAELDVSLGDTIDVRRQDGDLTRTVDVVGRAVLPGGDHDFPGGLGSGGVMTLAGMAALGEAPRNVYFLRAADDADPDAFRALLQESGPGFYGPTPGDAIDNLKTASAIIPWLVATLSLLAVIALVHGFTVTVRRRRPELAILASLGMRPRQLRSVVRWQAGAIATVALTTGLLLGLVLTKATWGYVARDLGVADDIAPLPPLHGLALVGVLAGVTLAIASWTAWSAGRTRPSTILRTE